MKNLLLTTLIILVVYSCEISTQSQSKPDIEPPTIHVTNLQDSMVVSGIVYIECEVTDNIGIRRVELMVDSNYVNIADSTAPFFLQWNTNHYKKGTYIIKARAIDRNGNIGYSDDFILMVDNSSYLAPDPVQITSVTYDIDHMLIIWNKSESPIFYSYELFFADSKSSTKEKLITTYSKLDTSYVLYDFDPTHENWFWVQVTDSLGYNSILSKGFMIIDSPPESSFINYVKYYNNSFYISWSKNHNSDFKEYRLFESYYMDMSDRDLVFNSFNSNDTLYTQISVGENEYRYYQIEVLDYWDLSSVSTVRLASSYPLIVYESTRNGNRDICSMDINGKNSNCLTSSSNDERNPIFSPDGSKIVYQKNSDLSIMDIWGENKNILTENMGNIYNTHFAPDGTKIIFSSNIDGDWDIYIFDLVNSQLTQLTINNTFDAFPRFFSSGEKIAFASERDGNSDIYIMDSDGGNVDRLTSTYFSEEDLQITPDDSKIIFVSSDPGLPAVEEIFSLNLDDSISTKLTNNGYSPLISPDGSRIYYHSLLNSWDIFVMDIDGQNKLNLTDSPGDEFMTDIYNNGSYLLFQYRYQNSHHIYRINIDGTNLLKLTDDNYQNTKAKFQPRSN